MPDVHAAFITELPHVLPAPPSWFWETAGRVQLCRHNKHDLYISIAAQDNGPTIRLIVDGLEANEHRRAYDWADPALLDQMEWWIKWLSRTSTPPSSPSSRTT